MSFRQVKSFDLSDYNYEEINMEEYEKLANGRCNSVILVKSTQVLASTNQPKFAQLKINIHRLRRKNIGARISNIALIVTQCSFP